VRVLAIARASVLRVVRDRTAMFFIVVLPIVLIVLVGAIAHGVTSFRVGVLDLDSTGPSRALVADLARTPGVTVTRFSSLHALDTALARSDLDTGLIVPHGLAAAERAGRPIAVPVLAEQANSSQQAAAAQVVAVVQREGGRIQAAEFATHYGGGFARNLLRADVLAPRTPGVRLGEEAVRAKAVTLPAGYEYSAPTELVLFVFLTAIAGGATIIETRRLGMFDRMSAAPVSPRTIILGESLTYVAIAAVQSALLVAVGALAFGVSWGNPLAAVVLLLVWCLVGAGAGMVAGTLFRTPEQASAIGPVVGIAFAMLGGCMWPLSIVSPAMRAVGHVTPQAWAVDAWTNLLASHGTLLTIGRELGVLALFALGFFVIATVRLGRTLSAGRA